MACNTNDVIVRLLTQLSLSSTDLIFLLQYGSNRRDLDQRNSMAYNPMAPGASPGTPYGPMTGYNGRPGLPMSQGGHMMPGMSSMNSINPAMGTPRMMYDNRTFSQVQVR